MIDLRKSMLERNPMTIGIAGTVLLIVILAVAFNFRSFSILSGDKGYHADFADASGLATGDPVMMGGISVGTITTIALSGDHVSVDFGVDSDARKQLGDSTAAAIKVRTLLGQRYIDLTSAGAGKLQPGSTIPSSRTSSGYDITRDLEQVTHKVAQTDKENLSSALDQLSRVQASLPDNLHQSIDGVRRLSETVGSRDDALKQLLGHSADVSGILADRNQQLAAMFGQGQSLFATLNRRAQTIHRVLVQTTQISQALNGLTGDVRQTLAPTLDQLGRVLDLLNKNYDNINQSISGLKNFTYQLGDAVGSGPFFTVIIQNIIAANLSGQQHNSPGAPR